MYVKLSDEAKEKLAPYQKAKAVIVLDLDDGVGTYSKMGVCSLDTSFRILVLNEEQEKKDFDLTLASDIGDIYAKAYSKSYLDESMTLTVDDRLQVLQLKSESGTLDGHVQIVDLRMNTAN